MPKRISEKQKKEMLDRFLKGEKIDQLSERYSCTKNTVTKHLKNILSESDFKKIAKNCNLKKQREKNNSKHPSSNLDIQEEKNLKEEKNQFSFNNQSFIEIAPLDYEMDNSSRKELSSVPISEVDFPKVVYMIVDKKIELEIKLLKDFPEWEFLPHDDLNRKTIEIFFDLNLAKRSCNKEQKVLKVPNTNVFRIAAPILISKGISRIVCAENLIAL